MKCPFRYSIVQITRDMQNDGEDIKNYARLFSENQAFAECYKEECMAYDTYNQKCKKISADKQ